MLNLFLALLINAFATDTIDKHKDEIADSNRLGQAVERLKNIFCCCCPFVKKNTVNPSKGKTSDSPDPLINSIIPEEEETDGKGNAQ